MVEYILVVHVAFSLARSQEYPARYRIAPPSMSVSRDHDAADASLRPFILVASHKSRWSNSSVSSKHDSTQSVRRKSLRRVSDENMAPNPVYRLVSIHSLISPYSTYIAVHCLEPRNHWRRICMFHMAVDGGKPASGFSITQRLLRRTYLPVQIMLLPSLHLLTHNIRRKTSRNGTMEAGLARSRLQGISQR